LDEGATADAGREPPDSAGDDLREAAPGLARIAARAWLNTAEWTIGSSLRAGSHLLRAAALQESPTELLTATAEELRAVAERARGGEPEDAPTSEADVPGPVAAGVGDDSSATALRKRGEELLRLSADVRVEEDSHPAYGRILEELAPDEARILRLLAEQGPQPSVDVRSGVPVIASELVAPGLTMIALEAGCRHVDRIQAYLNNLFRLGLIWFSREPVSDRSRYQVLEAQPDVAEALREAGRTGRTVRRSIHLTPFGEDFCKLALPLETAETEALGSESVGAEPPSVGGIETEPHR
jgi:Abortive infection alpha